MAGVDIFFQTFTSKHTLNVYHFKIFIHFAALNIKILCVHLQKNLIQNNNFFLKFKL